jgi:hypothetical protein
MGGGGDDSNAQNPANGYRLFFETIDSFFGHRGKTIQATNIESKLI